MFIYAVGTGIYFALLWKTTREERILHHAREMGIVGLFNVLRNYPMFRRIFDETVKTIAEEKPDAVMLVDYPGFNLRLARRCRELGLRVIYYISPQVWAWRRGRVT